MHDAWPSACCIFFLTFRPKHLIKGTQPRSRKSGAKSDVKGESLDDERNQEKGACQEEGCSEEKEVVTVGSRRASFNLHGPEQSGPFSICAPSNRGRSCW